MDDDPYTRRFFEGLLRKPGIVLQTAADLAQARQAVGAADFNLILLDQRLPDGNGLDYFSEIREERPQQIAILITGHSDIRDAMSAVRKGLFDYLTKPFESIDALEAVIGRALEMDRANREILELQEKLVQDRGRPLIIGHSPALARLQRQVRQVAPVDVTILIDGESGTGKEIFAKTIHALSRRSQAQFLEVNCGAVSESLLEATLFGYEKGAFTGAAKATPGYFEAVDGGTLFLDEIADMTPKLQASLLHVLQDQTFSRLGSTEQRRSDFRLISATNKPIEEEVKAGRFRSDLFYRLNVISLHVPPLRDRRSDILPLVMFFLDYFNRKFGKKVGPLTPEAISALETAPWPGNVRELKHAIERAVALRADGPLTIADFENLGNNPLFAPEPAETMPQPYRDARDIFERHYFQKLLCDCGGNVSEAARKSGIARQNFYTHLKRLGLNIPQ